MSSRRKAARYCVYGALGLATAAGALVFAVPIVLELPTIKAGLEQRLSQVVNGHISWETLEIHLLPSPHGVVGGVRVEIPGKLQARAGRVEARIRLLPLLRGRVEIVSLAALQPQVRVQLAADTTPAQESRPAIDPFAIYRSAAGAAVGVVRAFAPETVLAVQDAVFEIHAGGPPILRLHGLSLRSRTGRNGMDLELTTASEHWSRLRLEARVEYADLSGNATLEVDELRPQAWLDPILAGAPVRIEIPITGLRLQARTDGQGTLDFDFDCSTPGVHVAQGTRYLRLPEVVLKGKANANAQRASVTLGEVRLAGDRLAQGSIGYAFASGDAEGHIDFDLDLARTLTLARRVLAQSELVDLESAAGRLRGSFKFMLGGRGAWAGTLDVRDSDAVARVRQLPWAVGLTAVRVSVAPAHASVAGLRGTFGQSSFSDIATRMKLGKELRVESASGRATLDLDQIYPWAQRQEKLAEALQEIPVVAGTLDASLLRLSGPLAAPDYELRLVPRQVSVQAKPLPGPLTASGGAVRLTPRDIHLDQLAVALLDARMVLSGTVSDYATPRLRAEVVLSDGSAGTRLVEWAMRLAAVPPQLELRAPLRFSAKRVGWGPGRQLELDAAVRFDTAVGAVGNLAWTPDLLHLRRLEIEDPRGKGLLELLLRDRVVQGRFEGSLHGGVLASLLKDPPKLSGTVAGNLKFAVDLDQPRQASAEGTLQGEALDLAWLTGRPLVIEHFALAANRDSLRISEARVKVGQQSATLRGELKRGKTGPVIDARIDSPGILVDSLLPETKSAPPQPGADTPKLWPLPITGRIALYADHVQYGRYRAAPVVAALLLEEESARLEVQEAQLCGVAAPLSVEARPSGWAVAARIAAQRQQVEAMARCLTGEQVRISGETDFQASLSSRGRPQELLRNLEGTVAGEARDGRILKFALIGNILSMRSIAEITTMAEEGSEKRQEGFPYRKLAVKGRLHDGQFLLDEGAFDSPAVGMAANGTVRLSDLDSKLTVLVAPFGRVDQLVRRIPIFGYVLGGALTSVPVAVSGDIRDPAVVPLGPRAVSSELLGIFERTLKLPGHLIAPAGDTIK